MDQKNNARHVAKQSRAIAVISDAIVSRPWLYALVQLAQATLAAVGLWAFMWLMFYASGGVAW